MKSRHASMSYPQRQSTRTGSKSTLLCSLLAAGLLPQAMAANCISLRGSTTCPAFNQSSVSTSQALIGKFPFLQYVSDTSSFDSQFQTYVSTGYAQQKYQQILGCTAVNLTNTTTLYARYTETVLCNAIVQNSISDCKATGNAVRPVCAETCAAYANSEESIYSSDLCDSNNANALDQIRADFTTCALPAASLSGACIRGYQNEPDNCGFANNLPSLCSYCAASSPNSTDSCCLYSNTETRCTGVKLPITAPLGTVFPNGTTSTNSSSTSTPSAAAGTTNRSGGLSGGQIAGIVVGSVLGALLLLAIIVGCCIWARKRRNSQAGSMLNQPSPTRFGTAPPMSNVSSSRQQQRDTLPAGARVHQMVALEGTSSSGDHSSPIAGGGYVHSSSGYDDTPESQRTGLGVGSLPKRGGSLSGDNSSPRTDEYSSPEGLASGHSEQMSHFKDYYSQDEIRAGEVVATLWAYQPRANDEWELERGDMLKVVGIWDDGWATGVRLDESAEQWETRRNANRDSGVSNGSSRQILTAPGTADSGNGEIKAFPLVCVCLPQHWRKTIEGDVADPSTSNQPPSQSGSP